MCEIIDPAIDKLADLLFKHRRIHALADTLFEEPDDLLEGLVVDDRREPPRKYLVDTPLDEAADRFDRLLAFQHSFDMCRDFELQGSDTFQYRRAHLRGQCVDQRRVALRK